MDLLIGSSANYFSAVIIIVKYRISWPKKLNIMLYLWSYFIFICFIFDTQFYPLLTTCTTSPLARGFRSKTLWLHCWTTSLRVLLDSCSTQCWNHKVPLLVALPKREKLYLPVKSIHFAIFMSEILAYVYIVIQVSTNLTSLNIFIPPSQHSLAAGKDADF